MIAAIPTLGFGSFAGVAFVPMLGFPPAVIPEANATWHAPARGVVYLAAPRPVAWTAPARPASFAAPERR